MFTLGQSKLARVSEGFVDAIYLQCRFNEKGRISLLEETESLKDLLWLTQAADSYLVTSFLREGLCESLIVTFSKFSFLKLRYELSKRKLNSILNKICREVHLHSEQCRERTCKRTTLPLITQAVAGITSPAQQNTPSAGIVPEAHL